MNPNQLQLSRKVTPVSSVTKSSEIPSNEADLQKHHNLIHAKIMNIKENANRLNNEKVIYADEKFLLLKFQLTPLNDSNVQDVLNNGAEDIDTFERKFNVGKSKHLSGLFDSSIFDEDSKFFDDFNDFKHRTFYPEKPKGNFERRYLEDPNSYRSQNYKHNGNENSFSRQKSHSPKEPYFQGSKKYKSGKGVWIGNKYYPYHGPSFGKHPSRPGHHFGHGHDFSDEDSSDYSFSDCSDEYDESSEEDYGKDPGILYGKPRPDFVPTNGGYPGKGKVPGYIPTNGGDPGISNGKPVRPGYGNGLGPKNGQPRPGFTPVNGGDPGILYGNGGDPGILYGPPRPGFVPTNGRGPGNNGPVEPGIIPNGNNGGDTGILYGKPGGPGIIINGNGGDTGILYGPGNGATPPNNLPPTAGNNSDVVFLVIASQ
uniref:Uncharacterized protein n=1 Tax=Cacopsylla melanoneura TaxID=428564 RepID=A0A8D8R4F1_9HEMI